ncbi:hypothetical protein [uncultured Eubacterium sp.]|uniref:hypothetical protein n=1 Tax=uncultured Eubacterium sp. TaxID=165185 RepID=UPI0026715BB0|nr:hypothetical protein [uncultured Eubacterium sp.]
MEKYKKGKGEIKDEKTGTCKFYEKDTGVKMAPHMYELYKNGRMVGIYRNSEIAELLDIETSYVIRCAKMGTIIEKEYAIKRSNLTYQEALELKKLQPQPTLKKETKITPVKQKKEKYSAGRTFMLPDWNEIEKLRKGKNNN